MRGLNLLPPPKRVVPQAVDPGFVFWAIYGAAEAAPFHSRPVLGLVESQVAESGPEAPAENIQPNSMMTKVIYKLTL